MAIDDEVATELQDVVAAVRFLRQPAAQHHLHEPAKHARPEEVAQRRASKIEGPIGAAVGIGEGGKRQGVRLEKGGDAFRRAEADGHDLAAQFTDALVVWFHLAEVCPTCQSGEMSEEDEDDRPRRQLGQSHQAAVEPEERTVRNRITDLQHDVPPTVLHVW